MTNLKILVCDDLPVRGKEWEAKIKKATGKNPDGIYAEDFSIVLDEFYENFVNPILAQRRRKSSDNETYFDKFDIVVIDNNLGELKIGGLRPTAETIAGDIRAFSSCRYVVSLNKRPKIDFDLEHLFGDLNTKADIAIKSERLDSKWLWDRTASPTEEFRPWYWPCLSEAPDRRRKQIEFVVANLDTSIKAALNIPDESIGDIPLASQGDFSGVMAINFAKVTFRQFFVHGIRSFDERDRKKIANKDFGGSATTMARVIAAELEQWLRLNLLAPQTALVDVPHLIEREPAVLKGKGYAKIIRKSGKLETFNDGLLPSSFIRHRFKPDFWLPVPAYWWRPLRIDRKLQDLRNDFDDPRVSARIKVFCEDTSDFKDATEDIGPASFFCGFDTAYDERYVSDVSGPTYHPRTLLVS